MRIKNYPAYYKAKVIGSALQGNAKVWFDAIKYELPDYREFRERFRAEYLCEERQDRRKEIWRSHRYVKGSDILNRANVMAPIDAHEGLNERDDENDDSLTRTENVLPDQTTENDNAAYQA